LFGEQLVAVDDGGGEVDEFAVAGAGVLAQQVEGAALVDGVVHLTSVLGGKWGVCLTSSLLSQAMVRESVWCSRGVAQSAGRVFSIVRWAPRPVSCRVAI
jgi:hypothetical protein